MQSGFLDNVMPFISSLANFGFIWILTGVIFIAIKKYRATGFAVLIALLIGALTGNVILKPLVARVRPCDINSTIKLLIIHPEGCSFPSGHTLASFAAATAILRRVKGIGIFALMLAVAIAFSRLYLYVHYPSDVLGGIFIGIVSGLFADLIVSKLSLDK